MHWLSSLPVVRSLLWRLGRKLYCTARGDVTNDPIRNGEYWLLSCVQEHLAVDDRLVLLDVGANRGNWTVEALNHFRDGREIQIHAFEPCARTRELLAERLAGLPNVRIHPCALSDVDGDGIFYSSAGGEGTNSLDETSGPNRESVKLARLDSWLSVERIRSVAMMKIDTEGFDFLVLKGAERALSDGVLGVVQFEYNWRWLLTRTSLRDVFGLIEDKPYILGKLMGPAIEFYEEWHFELDRFFENNYLLVRKDSCIANLGRVVRFSSSNAPISVHQR